MPIEIKNVVVGHCFILNGRLHVSSDGTKGVGRAFENYKVTIVRDLRDEGRDALYPILLGDDYSNQLGWVSEDELTEYSSYFVCHEIYY